MASAGIDHAGAAHLERVWARHAVDVAASLARIDPALGTSTRPLADGVLVLQGAGMYVNRALAVGHARPFVPAPHQVLAELEVASRQAQLDPAIELSRFTDPSLVEACVAHGYRPGQAVSVMTRPLDEDTAASIPDDGSILVEPIATDELATWQDVSEAAWEIDTDDARRASRRFVAAVDATEGESLLLARDAIDGRPLGCATLIVRDGIGTLGGMSTLPAERRRGVQRALVRRRLHLASAQGCDLAAVSAVAGGPSEHNLLGLGFAIAYEKVTHTRRVG